MVQALLDADADVAARDCDGLTPLQQLAMTHETKPWAAAVARLLLASGAVAQPHRVDARAPAQCVPAGAARAGELHALLLAAEQA